MAPSIQTPRRSLRINVGRLIEYAVVGLLGVFFAFPFYAMAVASFMERKALTAVHPNLWPNPAILDNYRILLEGRTKDFVEILFVRALANSIILTLGQTVPALFFTALVGFVFAKRHFPGRDALFIVVLVTMMLPYQSTLVPFFLLMSKLNWLNTFWPLWVPWWVPAFGVFLMRQIIASTVPDELIDAATIDGCTLFGTFWRVVVPVIRPGLIVFGILNFMNAWNDYLYSTLMFSQERRYTATLFLALFKGSSIAIPEYGIMAAGSVLAMIPLFVVFFTFQRQLVSGIMAGAVKA